MMPPRPVTRTPGTEAPRTSGSWTVVLAAGAGRRLSAVTGGVPKQFWRGAHTVSLLEETLGRFMPFSAPGHTIIVVDAAHAAYVAALDLERAARVILQPEDRGTAAGVLLGLMPVLDADPDAIVTITPADHGVIAPAPFRRGILTAVDHVRAHDDLVLFGAAPTEVHADYGWITPGAIDTPAGLRPVRAFVEKPDDDTARRLFRDGAVWNTMVVVARARVLHALFARALPGVTAAFDALRASAPAVREGRCARVYKQLPRSDFSHDVLTYASNVRTYIWPVSMGWSDLGTPERLIAWQRQAGIARAAMPTPERIRTIRSA